MSLQVDAISFLNVARWLYVVDSLFYAAFHVTQQLDLKARVRTSPSTGMVAKPDLLAMSTTLSMV